MNKNIAICSTSLVALVVGIVLGRSVLPSWQKNKIENQTNATSSYLDPSSRSSNYKGSLRKSRPKHSSTQSWQTKVDQLMYFAKGWNGSGLNVNGFELFNLTREAAESMTSDEIKLALDKLTASDLQEDSLFLIQHEFIKAWCKCDPQRALAETTKVGTDLHRLGFWCHVIERWADKDASAVNNWITNNKHTLPETVVEWSESTLLRAMAKEDFDKTLAMVQSAEPDRQLAILQTLRIEVSSNPEKMDTFIEYLTNHTKPEHQLQLAMPLVMSLIFKDVDKAIDLVENWQGPGKAHLVSVSSYNWMQKDPEKALAWAIRQLDENPFWGDNIGNLVNQWASNDPAAATAWLTSQPQERSDTIRMNSYRQALNAGNYDKAAAWTSAIRNSSNRNKCYQAIYTDWIEMEPQGAEAWLSSLPEEDQAALRDSMKETP